MTELERSNCLISIYTSIVYTKIKQLATKLRFILIKMQNNYADMKHSGFIVSLNRHPAVC